MCFHFLTFVWNISHSKTTFATYCHKCDQLLHIKYPLFLSDFTLNFLHRFFKEYELSNFIKIRAMKAEFFHPNVRTDKESDRQTDRQTYHEADSRFSPFCERKMAESDIGSRTMGNIVTSSTSLRSPPILLIPYILLVILRIIRFNIQKFYVLRTEWVHVLCIDVRTNRKERLTHKIIKIALQRYNSRNFILKSVNFIYYHILWIIHNIFS